VSESRSLAVCTRGHLRRELLVPVGSTASAFTTTLLEQTRQSIPAALEVFTPERAELAEGEAEFAEFRSGDVRRPSAPRRAWKRCWSKLGRASLPPSRDSLPRGRNSLKAKPSLRSSGAATSAGHRRRDALRKRKGRTGSLPPQPCPVPSLTRLSVDRAQ